jgi:tetratricopeptide (TPR) repeat protein
LLIAVALAMLIFYPSPEPNKKVAPQKNATANKTFSAKALSLNLVSTFFNGTDEDNAEQVNALEKTINHLKTDTTSLGKKAFSDIKNNNLSGAIQFLTTEANKQKNSSDSSKLWVHVGNIQNLTSTKQALQAYQKANEKDPDNSNAWSRQGHIYRQLKQFDNAESAYRKVAAIDSKSTTNQALYLVNLAQLSQSKGDIKGAEESFLEALMIYTTFDNGEGIINTSESLARLYQKSRKYSKAETYYLTALAAHQTNEQTEEAVATYSALGDLYQLKNQPENAQTQYEKGLEISLNNNFEESAGKLYQKMGQLAENNGNPELAKQYLDKALLVNSGVEGGEKVSLSTADKFANLAIADRKKRKFDSAEQYHLKAIEIYTQNNHTSGITSQKINLGFLYKVWGKPQKACESWKSSIALLKRSKNSRLGSVQKLIRANCP